MVASDQHHAGMRALSARTPFQVGRKGRPPRNLVPGPDVTEKAEHLSGFFKGSPP